MTREERFYEATRVLEANGITCSDLRGIRFIATGEIELTPRRIEVELRPQVHIKLDNMYMGLYMCFPVRGNHYLLPHDTLVEIVGETANWLNTRSWIVDGQYTSRNPNSRMLQRLGEFRLHYPDSDQPLGSGAQYNWESTEPNLGLGTNSMLGSRWTRDQDLAVVSHSNASSPLHEAARAGHTDIARALVSAGADIHALDENGHTPLHVAASMGRADTAQFLIDVGANVNPRTGRGKTPLHTAIAEGDTDRARELISLGADVNARDEQDFTPLHWAVNFDIPDIVQTLISAGANFNARSEHGNTPLHLAVQSNLHDIVKILISHSVDLNARNTIGVTPLLSAVHYNHSQIIQTLISAGVDVDARSENGLTSLIKAVTIKQPDLVQILISAGADVNARMDGGVTSLYQAVNTNTRLYQTYLRWRERS